MKAFLSHSSKDKHFVRQVAKSIGEVRVEYDEYTFDYKLSSEEIRKALRRCSIFVLFLSENSINSNFVKEELRDALDARNSGAIRQVLILALDDTSYQALPEWMQEINVAQKLSSPKQISRRIETYLSEMELSQGDRIDYYFGRDDEESELIKSIARPVQETPLFVSIVGIHGVGRRTFIHKSLQKASPRKYAFLAQITANPYDSALELYRKLYELTEVSNPLVAAENFASFDSLPDPEKSSVIAAHIREISAGGGLLTVIDEGGVLNDEGDFQPHFKDVLDGLREDGQPMVALIQTRMMKYSYRKKYPRALHIRLNALTEETVRQILSLTLNEMGINYTAEEARELASHVDGQPLNVRLVASYAAEYGIDAVLADPSEIVEFKATKGMDYISRIEFSEIEGDIICLLKEYQYCDLEFLSVAMDREPAELVESIRKLEDFCCVEQRDRMLTVSPPLRHAIRRDERFRRTNSWLSKCAVKVIEAMSQYEGQDSISLSFIDSALPDLIRSGKEIPFVSALMLPSHFLRVGRTYYDRGDWERSIEFCDKALEAGKQFSIDGRIEANRLVGLARTRIAPNDPEIENILAVLRGFRTRTSRRIAFFIEGFRARKRGEYDIAERKFVEAAELDPENFHVNRELSSVLCRVGRYAEAEPYARAAYQRAQDNPYILDVFIEALEGKQKQGLAVEQREIQHLNEQLKRVCDAGKLQFYNIREARKAFAENEKMVAFGIMGKVIGSASENPEEYMTRSIMYLRAGSAEDARKDIKKLRDLARKNPEAVQYADEAEAEALIAEGRFPDAKRFIDARFMKAVSIRSRLLDALKRAIAYEPQSAPDWLKDWARTS